MEQEYTHILSLKVWSKSCHFTTDYKNIEKKVLNELINKDFTENVEIGGLKQLIKINWVEKKWSDKMSVLTQGNLVANLNYSSGYDQFIYKHTETILKQIEQKFKDNNDFHSDWEIIFNIVKPLSRTTPNIDHVALYRY
jgi:hypothetical protein